MNTVRAIHYSALSHLWFLFVMLQCSPSDAAGLKKNMAALFIRQVRSCQSLDGLRLTDPPCVLHKVLKGTPVLLESSDDFVADAVRLKRAASSYVRSRYSSFEQRVRRCIASLESKIPVDIHPSLSGKHRLDAVRVIHGSEIYLKHEASSLQAPGMLTLGRCGAEMFGASCARPRGRSAQRNCDQAPATMSAPAVVLTRPTRGVVEPPRPPYNVFKASEMSTGLQAPQNIEEGAQMS
ncbi:hypothetical protein RF11_01422 [Thelohanellus kitauei]|uniref:Secreted protein n=1 Tax=Thelohanellus kitauei TaxID=669202 RepID=A0A0C2IDG1_THEKT|nr:hypothetical protein RF11_01422 [Thelohanellus kitauei]